MFTTVIHPLRKALLLSVNEYCILDSIRHLSNNTKYGGWCIMSKSKLGEALDLSRTYVQITLNTLELKGLIERQPKTNMVRSTDEYNRFFMLDGVSMIAFDDIISIDPAFFTKINNNNPKKTNKKKGVKKVNSVLTDKTNVLTNDTLGVNKVNTIDIDDYNNKYNNKQKENFEKVSPGQKEGAVTILSENKVTDFSVKTLSPKEIEKQNDNANCEAFLLLFNDIKKSKVKTRGLSVTSKNNLKKLIALGYGPEEFRAATEVMVVAEWPNKNGAVTPSHLLALDNFERYLNLSDSKENKKQRFDFYSDSDSE